MVNKSIILLLDCYSIVLILTYSFGTHTFHDNKGENNSIDWFPKPGEEHIKSLHQKSIDSSLDTSQMLNIESSSQATTVLDLSTNGNVNIERDPAQPEIPIGSQNSSTIQPEGVRDGAQSSTVAPREIECQDENYCLNGGTCILTESGQMMCLCPESFYGARCQTKNICKTIIADSMTGDQICARIERECFMNDKFFRCSCHQDEYFIFKNNQYKYLSNKKQRQGNENRPEQGSTFSDIITSSYMLNDESSTSETKNSDTKNSSPATYLAECRKINKCLGVRCRQMSEVCQEGVCVCNQDAGYIKDLSDGLCKLLDPCKVPTADGEPICGQAQCVATYDHELYRCLCPVGYRAIKVGSSKSSTQCALLTDTICDVPLLNKCQHICQVDRTSNNYKCSCLPGYKAGKHQGVDDHMCFFDEHLDHSKYIEESLELSRSTSFSENSVNQAKEYVYKTYLVPKQTYKHTNDKVVDNTITYDPLTTTKEPEEIVTVKIETDQIDLNSLKTHETLIKRELRSARDSKDNFIWSGRNNNDSSSNYGGTNLNKMSAQDRCNMYCEENKICVLESGTIDSYRCVCDRQGYVSVGDRCLDWCAAADFSYRVLGLLEMICWSGVCKPSSLKPSQAHDFMKIDDEQAGLERESSWRPTFECDCSSSPLLIQDSDSKLCKLDFQAIIKPCLPGNIGYIDCVEHKNAYCAVLHKNSWSFIRDLQKERPGTETNLKPTSLVGNMKGKGGDEANRGSSSKAKAKVVADKLYTCVCSPEKKFLVDKPRNKERCVDECDLLNIECGRFNRMCRAATIAPDDFGKGNLVRVDPDGVRMNFKSAGCECLPGFNVGPTESVDFTIDDNKPSSGPLKANIVPGIDTYPPLSSIIDIDNLAESENLRAKYMNINSRCLLDYDVVEFHASFKAPADFDPNWIKIKQSSSNSDKKPYKSLNSQISRVETAKEIIDENGRDSKETSASSDNHAHNINANRDDKVAPSIEACGKEADCLLKPPNFMSTDISALHKNVVLVSQCDPSLAPLSIEAYRECTKYRYWIVQKLRNHFVDWRSVLTQHLSKTFDLMEGNIRLKVNKCEATIRSISNSINANNTKHNGNNNDIISRNKSTQLLSPGLRLLSPIDQISLIDADIDCELTLHSAGDESSPRYVRKVLLEKQLQKFIFVDQAKQFGQNYYLMAPNMLILRDSFDQLAEHRKLFNPCKSDYAYCDKQTKCEMVDTVNFTCTCEYGYTPIGSRDIYYADSRKEVCEDINECLFDVCKELADASTCINEIGDYRCQCNRHYTGDNKRFCTHVCNTISCKHGKCRLVGDHHAFCECDEGYKETDCSVQDPNVALRKANMIIFGSIFTSVLLLAITIAISLNSQLKKTKKKLKRLEAVSETANLFEYPHQQPFRTRMSSKVSSTS